MTTPTPPVVIPGLASVTDLQDFMEAELTPAAELVLAAATSMVRRYCGWHIHPVISGVDLTVDSFGGCVLALPTLSLLDVISVDQKTWTGPNGWQTVDLDYIDWSDDGYLYRTTGRWPMRPRGVRATITHGLENAEELQQVVLTMAARALVAPTGAVSQTVGAVSVNYGAGGEGGPGGGVRLYSDQLATLDRYRIFGRA